MKKNVLALSIATMIGGLGFAGAASAALTVAPSGAGQILVVPYYTAQAGNTTAFHITNTDKENGKAVKVRFRGASNSDDVLDFQVFLSPGDVWTAAVSADANGLAQLKTSDNSCTLPKIEKDVAVPFIKTRLKGGVAADNAETREGYIEILNMADIDPKAEYQAATGQLGAGLVTTGGTSRSALYTATKHVNGVAPCTSAVLDALNTIDPTQNGLVKGSTAATLSVEQAKIAANWGLTSPTGGLVGQWYVINVPNSTTFSGTATAINDNAAATTVRNNLYSPQMRGAAKLVSADPLILGGLLEAQHYDVPDLSTPVVGGAAATLTTGDGVVAANAQATQLNTALAVSNVSNQFLVGAGVNATTDWVLSMPARRYIVAANYAATSTAGFGLAETPTAGTTAFVPALAAASTIGDFAGNVATKAGAYRVFNTNAGAATLFGAKQANTTVNSKNQICAVAESQTFMDREEREEKDGAVFSPGEATKLEMCGEVSTVTFGASSVLGSTVANTKATPSYAEGWGTVVFGAPVPVLGAAFTKASNPAANAGMVGNYGITWAHTSK